MDSAWIRSIALQFKSQGLKLQVNDLGAANNFVYFSIHITIRKCIFTEIFKRFREWHDNILVTALISMPIIVFVLFLFYTMLPYFLLKTLVLFVVSKGQTQTKLTLWYGMPFGYFEPKGKCCMVFFIYNALKCSTFYCAILNHLNVYKVQ